MKTRLAAQRVWEEGPGGIQGKFRYHAPEALDAVLKRQVSDFATLF